MVLEPDSLANLVTNMAVPTCAAAEQIYRRGIAYAISKLSLPNVYIYIDGAHAGWLGWPKNLPKGASACSRRCWTMAGGADRIRGFALNVSNYDPPRDPNGAKRRTPTTRARTSSATPKIWRRARQAGRSPARASSSTPAATARRTSARRRGNWCNVKGAGLGERPRVAPAPNIDAYLWIKTPGESDGTADPKAARFDENCVSDDAMPGAPEAGELFAPYLLDLAKNANPPL